MGGVENAPGFSVATLPTRCGDLELQIWEPASSAAGSGQLLAGAGDAGALPGLRVRGDG